MLNPLKSAFHIFKTIIIFNSIPASAPFLASFLAPFWIPFGVPFGSTFGVPATDRFVREHKENKAFWAFEVSPERPFRELFWTSFWRPFWAPFGWSFRAARGDGNIAFLRFHLFKIIIIFNSIMEAASWIEIMTLRLHWIPAFHIFFSINFQDNNSRPAPSGLKMKLS